MDSGGIIKKGLSNSNDQPCEICGLRVRIDLVLCVQYCNSVHSRGGDGQWRHYKERLV